MENLSEGIAWNNLPFMTQSADEKPFRSKELQNHQSEYGQSGLSTFIMPIELTISKHFMLCLQGPRKTTGWSMRLQVCEKATTKSTQS